ncbi:MAG: hypothetical protein QXK88_02585 [Desulfurococcaceae archaeon]
MKLLSKPPRIKVLEAAGALGDRRIDILSETEAVVRSSMGDKEYRVVLIESNTNTFRAYSNDNGTVFRGYVGYPIVAFMMAKDILPVDNEVTRAVSGIPWKDLNERYKKYSIVENIVLSRAEKLGVSRAVIDEYINVVLKKMSFIKIYFDETLSRGE